MGSGGGLAELSLGYKELLIHNFHVALRQPLLLEVIQISKRLPGVTQFAFALIASTYVVEVDGIWDKGQYTIRVQNADDIAAFQVLFPRIHYGGGNVFHPLEEAVVRAVMIEEVFLTVPAEDWICSHMMSVL
ncbi:hypothetical protein, unlikely [Trypanosoma congolense IL3000]|uniref:Uncharacterized protein n=1 Tax=Trypanosoma congolense (strain IL3000) TaxID=1068625 RepID=F9W6B2_TRYCI|nr:hypothetical protein, unlikely [Trypanosoma congolense IL3000]